MFVIILDREGENKGIAKIEDDCQRRRHQKIWLVGGMDVI